MFLVLAFRAIVRLHDAAVRLDNHQFSGLVAITVIVFAVSIIFAAKKKQVSLE
jgi:multisubunit Na+/H+ antiporter MnhG subunit